MPANGDIQKSLDTEEINQNEKDQNNQVDLNMVGEQRLVTPRLNISDQSIDDNMVVGDGFKSAKIAKSSKFEGRS